MDQEPFFEFNMLDFIDSEAAELQRYANSSFEVSNIVEAARELKYTTQIKSVLDEEFRSPSQEFVHLIARRAYGGRISPSIRKKFEALAPATFADFLRERVKATFRSVLEPEEDKSPRDAEVVVQEEAEAPQFTELEQEALYVIKAILRDIVDVPPRRSQGHAVVLQCSAGRQHPEADLHPEIQDFRRHAPQSLP